MDVLCFLFDPRTSNLRSIGFCRKSGTPPGLGRAEVVQAVGMFSGL
jgi:hypothetical protein